MDLLAKHTADTVTGIGAMLGLLGKIPGMNFALQTAQYNLFSPFQLAGEFINRPKQPSYNTPRDVANAKSTMSLLNVKERKAENDLIKKANALRALENATNAAKLKAAADQATIDALKKKLDVERIGIEYALTQTTDATTRAVLQGKLAIMDEDAKAAKAASLALDAAQAATLNQLDALALAAARSTSAAGTNNYSGSALPGIRVPNQLIVKDQ